MMSLQPKAKATMIKAYAITITFLFIVLVCLFVWQQVAYDGEVQTVNGYHVALMHCLTPSTDLQKHFSH